MLLTTLTIILRSLFEYYNYILLEVGCQVELESGRVGVGVSVRPEYKVQLRSISESNSNYIIGSRVWYYFLRLKSDWIPRIKLD